jgi:ABC-type multidrug transport system permease subunit
MDKIKWAFKFEYLRAVILVSLLISIFGNFLYENHFSFYLFLFSYSILTFFVTLIVSNNQTSKINIIKTFSDK